MKREILFRGFNEKHKEWRYGYYFVSRGLHFIVDDEVEENLFQSVEDFCVNPDTIGQYTGVDDNNKTLIFCGDIVRIKVNLEEGTSTYASDVKFEDGCYLVKDGSGDYNMPLYACVSPAYPDIALEVIGNVYDNKELLEVKK